MNRTVFDNNKLVYIPAVLPSKGLYEKIKIDSSDKYHHFWNKLTSVWNYKNMLLSAYHAKDIKDVHKEFDIDDDVFILGDSGGFQLITLGGDITPEEVINWQKANCTAGLILDRPPYNFGGGAQFSGTPSKKFFQECLDKTKNNAKVALQNKGDLKLYGVIQGETYDQMCLWYEQMHQVELDLGIEFDAWALSPKPSDNPIKVALFGILVQEYKINKPLHILQISGRSGILVSALFRHQIGRTITIDSSSFYGSSRYGMLINPDKIPSTIEIGQKLDKKDRQGWLCDCPICSVLNMNVEKLDNNYIRYLDIHNLYQIVKFVKYADYIVQFDEIILQQSENNVKCNTAIKMLLFYRDNGFQSTKIKFSEYFNKIEDNEQLNIFNF